MWVHYARAEDAYPNLLALYEAMNDRPLPVVEGKRPAGIPQVERKTRGNTKPAKVSDHWHLRSLTFASQIPACGSTDYRTEVFGFKRFTRLSELAKVCPKCHALWAAEMLACSPRSKCNR